MNPNSAYKLVKIVAGVDYSPTTTYIRHGSIDPELAETEHDKRPKIYGGKTPPIFALLCTQSTGTGYCKIQLIGNDTPVEMPSQSFRQGVVYHMYLKTLVDDDDKNLKFVGFQYKEPPEKL